MKDPVSFRRIGPARDSVRNREESIVAARKAGRYSRLTAENGNPKRERGSRLRAHILAADAVGKARSAGGCQQPAPSLTLRFTMSRQPAQRNARASSNL